MWLIIVLALTLAVYVTLVCDLGRVEEEMRAAHKEHQLVRLRGLQVLQRRTLRAVLGLEAVAITGGVLWALSVLTL